MYDVRCTMYDLNYSARCAGIWQSKCGWTTRMRCPEGEPAGWWQTGPAYVRRTMYDLGNSRACARIWRSAAPGGRRWQTVADGGRRWQTVADGVCLCTTYDVRSTIWGSSRACVANLTSLKYVCRWEYNDPAHQLLPAVVRYPSRLPIFSILSPCRQKVPPHIACDPVHSPS